MSLPSELSSLNISTCKLYMIGENVLHIIISSNRANSMTKKFWSEYRMIFQCVSYISSIRCILVSGSDSSKVFTSGLDLQDHSDAFGDKINDEHDIARESYHHMKFISAYQQTFNAMEEARQPVIVGISGACIGMYTHCVCLL